MLEFQQIDINTENCGTLSVFYHGCKGPENSAIITVHDIGCNAQSQFLKFVSETEFTDLTKKFLWIHITLPGQANQQEDLPNDYKFPSLQEIADDLDTVLNHFEVKTVIVFGEGLGASVLASYAINRTEEVIGAVFINLIGQTESFISRTNRRISIGSKLESQGMNTAAEDFLIKHRFGIVKDTSHQELKSAVEAFKLSLNRDINPKNLHHLLLAFCSRPSLKEKIGKISCPVLFVTGANWLQQREVVDLFHSMQKAFDSEPLQRSKIEMISFPEVSNVLTEKPERVAESLVYFLQGLGYSVSISAKVRKISAGSPEASPTRREPGARRMSMEDYDQPKGRDFYRSQNEPLAEEETCLS